MDRFLSGNTVGKKALEILARDPEVSLAGFWVYIFQNSQVRIVWLESVPAVAKN